MSMAMNRVIDWEVEQGQCNPTALLNLQGLLFFFVGIVDVIESESHRHLPEQMMTKGLLPIKLARKEIALNYVSS
jgi:hypothetical protein